MAKIKYVGLKESRADTVAGTGIVWHGQGDVREVPDLAVSRLLRHPDIWRLSIHGEVASQPPPPPPPPPPPSAPAPAPVAVPVNTETVPHGVAESQTQDSEQPPPPAPAPAPSNFVMQTDAGPLVLDGMDRDTLMALAKESNLSPHPQTGADKLRALLVKKFPVEAK